MRYAIFTVLLLPLILGSLICSAQSSPALHDSLYSSALQEQRQFDVLLAKDYDPAKPVKYEVLYCLDGITEYATTESFGVRDEYNRIDSAFYEVGTPLPPVAKPAGIQSGELHYSLCEGNRDSLPALARIKPTRSGRGGFDFSTFSSTGYVIAFDGYIYIDSPGYYIFENGGKQFKLTIGSRRVLGDHISPGGESFMLPLAKGYYPLHAEYLHVSNTNAPEPLYLKPGNIDDFPVPPGMLYSEK